MRLRSYLIALVVTTLVPLILVLAVAASWVIAGVRVREGAEMARLATAAAGAVLVAIEQRTVIAQSLAGNTGLLDPRDIAPFEALARRVARATGTDIIAAGRDGVQVVNTWVPSGEPIAAQPRPDLAERALALGRPLLTEALPGPRTGSPVAALIVATDDAHGQPFFVVARVEVERLAALLPVPVLWDGGFALLFDSRGAVVAHAPDALPPAVMALRADSDAGGATRILGLERIGAEASLAPVGATGWHVAVGAPAGAIAPLLRRATWTVLALSVLGVAVAVGLAIGLGRFLLGEARSLVATAQSLGEDMPAPAEPRVTELGVLQRALAQGAGALRDRADALARVRVLAENAAHLEQRVAERTRELEDAAGRLLNAQDEERRRIARDLHDSTVQELVAASLSLAQLDSALGSAPVAGGRATIAEARASIDRAKEELRTVSYLLQPPLLDECGLATAVRVYAEGFARRSGLRVGVTAPDGFPALPRSAETALFRVIQEALANVHNHARATSVAISLDARGNEIRIEVTDDGRGMNADETNGGNGLGVGIPGMRARLSQLEGTIAIHTGNTGTRLVAQLPLHGAEAPWQAPGHRRD